MQKHEHTPENNMSPNEIALHQDIYNGEGSEGIDVVETFLAAKTSLHAQIEEIMQGGGESTQEVEAYLNSFLVASAQGFAKMLQLSEASLDDKLQFGATVLLQSLQEIEKISEEYGCDVSIDTEPVELSELIEAMEEELEESDDEIEKYEVFEQTFGSLHAHIIGSIINQSPLNINDQRRSERQELKTKAFNAVKETAKVALSAGVVVMAVRFFNKNQ